MYGKDIEKAILNICAINSATVKQIKALGMVADYRLETISHTHNVHGHCPATGTGNNPTNGVGIPNIVSDQLTYPAEYTNDLHPRHPHVEHSLIYERQHPESGPGYIAPILAAAAVFSGEIVGEFKTIEGLNYAGITTFNNCYGSPWTEIYDLQDRIVDMTEYANAHASLQWIGEKHTLVHHMQLVLTTCVDAKWAIINYHDWIQRGYDYQFNDKHPSITWEDFVRGETIGNISQEIEENVRLRAPTNRN